MHRVLLASTNHDDIVLDPFAGTGTTRGGGEAAAAAFHWHRTSSGLCRGRHRAGPADAAGLGRGRHVAPTKREATRIPFGSLVEQGLIAAGTTVFDRQRRVSAMVGPDGSLSSGDIAGRSTRWGAAAERAELQWLDVLAFRARRNAAAAGRAAGCDGEPIGGYGS